MPNPLGQCLKCHGDLCLRQRAVATELRGGGRDIRRVTEAVCERCATLHPDHPFLAEQAAIAQAHPQPRPVDLAAHDFPATVPDRVLALEKLVAGQARRLEGLEDSLLAQGQALASLREGLIELRERGLPAPEEADLEAMAVERRPRNRK